MSSGLGIREVADQTGIAAGTLRMWEQRYGFPEPRRDASGYRVYSEADVQALRRVAGYRDSGLSVAAAIERASETPPGTDHVSLYAALTSAGHAVRPQVLRRSTLIALSRAIEHETLAQAARPVLVGAFQEEENYREVEGRYRRMARFADAACVFADFPEVRHPEGAPVELPISPEDKLGNEWAVVVDAPGYCAALLGWELPDSPDDGSRNAPDRRFEALWTLDPVAVRHASEVAATLASRHDPVFGAALASLLADRPLAMDRPAAGLTALTNRIVAYLESR